MAGDGCFWRWPAPLGVIATTRARQTKNVASCNWPMKPGCSKGNKQARPALIRRGALRSTCSLPWERRVPTPLERGPRRLARPALRQRQTGDEVLDTAGFARLAERSSHRGAHGANGQPWSSAVAALPPARSLLVPKPPRCSRPGQLACFFCRPRRFSTTETELHPARLVQRGDPDERVWVGELLWLVGIPGR